MITRATCKELRAKLETALKSIEAEMGLSIEVGNMRFDASAVNVSLRAVDLEATGGKSEGAAMLEELYPDLVGKTIRLDGQLFDITEVLIDGKGRVRKTRGDVAIGIKQVVGGKSYKCSARAARNNIVEDTRKPVQPQPAPQPQAPKSQPAPAQPKVATTKKDVAIKMIKEGASRADVINALMTKWGSSKASASTTYQNAKKEVGA